MYYRRGSILAVHIDDCILATNGREDMERTVKELADKFEITKEGDIDEYLGLKVEWQKDGSIKLSQLLLIRQILEVLGFNEITKASPPWK